MPRARSCPAGRNRCPTGLLRTLSPTPSGVLLVASSGQPPVTAGEGMASESARAIIALLLTEEKPVLKPSSYSSWTGVSSGTVVAGATGCQPVGATAELVVVVEAAVGGRRLRLPDRCPAGHDGGEAPGDQEGAEQKGGGDASLRRAHRCEPAPAKKLINVTAPPVRAAAAKATSTPALPRPAREGLTEWLPTAHTIAEINSPARLATRPIVRRAPTMLSSSEMPGSPEEFGAHVDSCEQIHGWCPFCRCQLVFGCESADLLGAGHRPGAGSRRAIRPPATNVGQVCTATPYCGSIAEMTRPSPR